MWCQICVIVEPCCFSGRRGYPEEPSYHRRYGADRGHADNIQHEGDRQHEDDRGHYDDRRRGRGRGRGGHPSGLTGRELGLFYAARGRAKKKERDLKEVR